MTSLFYPMFYNIFFNFISWMDVSVWFILETMSVVFFKEFSITCNPSLGQTVLQRHQTKFWFDISTN